MNVLIVGNGGRENALARKSKKSSLVEEVYVVSGNSAMDNNLNIVNTVDASNFNELEKFCVDKNIELIIVGNEVYLSLGITDYFDKTNIKIFAPSKIAAKIETSKDFAKNLMNKYDIETAKHYTFDNLKMAKEHLDKCTYPVVIKQDGLALGKGVLVSDNEKEANEFLIDSFKSNDKVIFEEFLEGEEFSLLCFCNGKTYYPMLPARDYKRAYNNDKGLNTGGMGCYTPVPFVNDDDLLYSYNEIIQKTLDAMDKEGVFYKGILYAGLIKTKEGIKVIEFNARFGDPETEVLMEQMESDLIEVVLNILENKEYSIKWKEGYTVGVCLASNGYPLDYEKGCEVNFLKDIDFYSMALDKKGDKYYTNGGRVLFVAKSSETLESAREKVYGDIENIKSDGLFCRTDIGKI